ncbi:MAG: SRPBCC domain-containing protein [Rhodobacteraceae bacterium]|nr:SRPBCC domain-containing protein [Paracoccaceae bacterium]
MRPPLPLTAEILIEPEGAGARYTACAFHGDAATAQDHADKGFHMGWGTAATQLEDLMTNLREHAMRKIIGGVFLSLDGKCRRRACPRRIRPGASI